jgi:hypothetical protein
MCLPNICTNDNNAHSQKVLNVLVFSATVGILFHFFVIIPWTLSPFVHWDFTDDFKSSDSPFAISPYRNGGDVLTQMQDSQDAISLFPVPKTPRKRTDR